MASAFDQAIALFAATQDSDTQEAIKLTKEIVDVESTTPPSKVSLWPASFLGSGQSAASQALPYLRAVRWYQDHRWVLPVGIATAVLGIGYVGYEVGRRKGR